MMLIIIVSVFVLGIAVGVGVSYLGEESKGSGLKKANETRNAEYAEALEKVLALARAQVSVTNNDVEVMLGVSDATATRYLQELESQGKLVQQGAEGQSVRYSLKSSL